jgi:hypothetical protein
MNNQFQIFNNFKGFGNPKGKIWFVGLEEAADLETNFEQNLKIYDSEYIPFKNGDILEDANKKEKNYTQVYNVMSKIMAGLFSISDWRTYRNKLSVAAGSRDGMFRTATCHADRCVATSSALRCLLTAASS